MSQNNKHADDQDFFAPKTAGHHIISSDILFKVMMGLFGLTILTIFTSHHFINLGIFASTVAFLIAFVKAMLVMSYFMGLKYDEKSNRVIFGAGFFFLMILLVFCAIDIWTRVAQTSTL
jgi:cytochrome c oxidase subunit 4